MKRDKKILPFPEVAKVVRKPRYGDKRHWIGFARVPKCLQLGRTPKIRWFDAGSMFRSQQSRVTMTDFDEESPAGF